MLDFIQNQIMFYFSLVAVLFLPGYFLLGAVFGRSRVFSKLEKFVVAFGLSIITVDILMIFMDKFQIIISKFALLVSLAGFLLFCRIIYLVRRKKNTQNIQGFGANQYSKKQLILILAIILFSIFIRSLFLARTIVPTGTDLGHHMYWVKQIMVTGQLSDYKKADIIERGGEYAIGEPALIDDFIVGEHLIFAAIGLLSGQDVISAFPSLVLLLINIMGLLSIFILAEKIFSFLPYGRNVAITSLFLLGSLFALSGAQGNFISGGVIGNLLGNLFISLAFYFLLRGLVEKNNAVFAMGIVTIFGLAYTHHLSTFIFGFSLVGVLFLILAIDWRESAAEIKKWSAMIFSKSGIFVIVCGFVFFFAVKMPGYIENQAVKTVVGEPSRSTKAGLSLSQLQEVVGESRAVLGVFGIILLLGLARKNKYSAAIVWGWFFAIFVMSWKPTLLHIDIPSSRIGNYLIFPLILSGAFALNWLFASYLRDKQKDFINPKIASAIFIIFTLYVATSGFSSQTQSIQIKSANSNFIETFAVSGYLAGRTGVGDVIVKDHNYVSADSWMKLFFMRDYNYPFTRSFLFRYDSAKREKCTLWVISTPKSTDAKKCLAESGINFIVVNPQYDSSQFNDSKQFWKVYSSKLVETYYHPQS
jgi:hypothetical protein